MAVPNLSDINDFFVTQAGIIEQNMDRKDRVQGYQWNQLVQRNSFPLGVGFSITKTTLERSGPSSPFSWNTIAQNPAPPAAGSGNNANVPSVTVNPASTNYTYSLSYGAIDSAPISIHDINLSVNRMEQLDYDVFNLEGNVLDIWEDRKQDEYDRLAGHKVICQLNGAPESGSDQSWLSQAPTSQLTLEFLKYGYNAMMRDGGQRGLDTVQGQPTPLVILEPEALDQILYNNEGHRKDIRYSSESDVLLNPLGINMAYGQFKYAVSFRIPRHDYNPATGVWTRRAFYSDTATTIGNKQDNSILYNNAAYGTAYIFHPDVYELLMYNPEASIGQASWDARSWNGNVFWLNTKDNVYNKYGHTGYFSALLASSSRPKKPSLGWAFRYRRCPGNFNAVTCPGC